ncbi:ATP-binding cassette domain-containing protein [Paenibacillaceae bacterium]|nr:ATP-binding cassette domain-containing protein [Paenibacillaceae bacterium]
MIQLQHINKTYPAANGPVQVIDSVSLQVQHGEIYGIIGFSGAGKSTLLRSINLLERPDSGAVLINGENIMLLSRKALLKRRMSMGMIFQHFNLIGNRTVYENVSFPLEIAGVPRAERKRLILESLEVVGLLEKAGDYPAKLSGGQKQRVAIARTMAQRPQILLCDEPTSALDPHTTESILAFLKQLNETRGITIVIVTHEMEVIKSICSRVSVMEQGKLVETINLSDPRPVPQTQIANYLLYGDRARVSGEVLGYV